MKMINVKNKIVFISNIICKPYLRICLSNTLLTFGSNAHLSCISYNEIDKRQSEVEKAEIIIVFLNFETLYPNVINDIGSKNIFEEDIVRDADMKMHELYSKIKMNSSAKIIWFGFEDYYINYNNVFGAIPLLSSGEPQISFKLILCLHFTVVFRHDPIRKADTHCHFER